MKVSLFECIVVWFGVFLATTGIHILLGGTADINYLHYAVLGSGIFVAISAICKVSE